MVICSHRITEIWQMNEDTTIHKRAQLLDSSADYEVIHKHDRIISDINVCSLIVFVLQLLNAPPRQLENQWGANMQSVFYTCHRRSKNTQGRIFSPLSRWLKRKSWHFHFYTVRSPTDNSFRVLKQACQQHHRGMTMIVFSCNLSPNDCRTSVFRWFIIWSPGWLLWFCISVICSSLQSVVAKRAQMYLRFLWANWVNSMWHYRVDFFEQSGNSGI